MNICSSKDTISTEKSDNGGLLGTRRERAEDTPSARGKDASPNRRKPSTKSLVSSHRVLWLRFSSHALSYVYQMWRKLHRNKNPSVNTGLTGGVLRASARPPNIRSFQISPRSLCPVCVPSVASFLVTGGVQTRSAPRVSPHREQERGIHPGDGFPMGPPRAAMLAPRHTSGRAWKELPAQPGPPCVRESRRETDGTRGARGQGQQRCRGSIPGLEKPGSPRGCRGQKKAKTCL